MNIIEQFDKTLLVLHNGKAAFSFFRPKSFKPPLPSPKATPPASFGARGLTLLLELAPVREGLPPAPVAVPD